jgi:phosphoribosylaminoimidazole-succinocarboxamide synthase
MSEALLTTQLALPNRRSGKVRDLYDTTLPDGEPALLIVATDRISAFDVVLANGLPGKGIVLTQISKFWFEHFADRFAHHLVSSDVGDVVGITDAQRRALRGRIMLCRKAEVLPIECIARGYLTGSGWQDYQRSGKVCGIELPTGLVDGDRLAEPLFTPSTKAETGHDENISFEQGAAIVGSDRMRWLRQTTLALYGAASDYARARGIILADTKFEFGIPTDSPPGAPEAFLIDEIFTPDSSRFWPAAQWQPGAAQPSFDKQVVRDYLQQQVNAGAWDKTPPGPMLPESIVTLSVKRYLEAFERLTGSPLDLAQYAD